MGLLKVESDEVNLKFNSQCSFCKSRVTFTVEKGGFFDSPHFSCPSCKAEWEYWEDWEKKPTMMGAKLIKVGKTGDGDQLLTITLDASSWQSMGEGKTLIELAESNIKEALSNGEKVLSVDLAFGGRESVQWLITTDNKAVIFERGMHAQSNQLTIMPYDSIVHFDTYGVRGKEFLSLRTGQMKSSAEISFPQREKMPKSVGIIIEKMPEGIKRRVMLSVQARTTTQIRSKSFSDVTIEPVENYRLLRVYNFEIKIPSSWTVQLGDVKPASTEDNGEIYFTESSPGPQMHRCAGALMWQRDDEVHKKHMSVERYKWHVLEGFRKELGGYNLLTDETLTLNDHPAYVTHFRFFMGEKTNLSLLLAHARGLNVKKLEAHYAERFQAIIHCQKTGRVIIFYVTVSSSDFPVYENVLKNIMNSFRCH